MPFRILREEKWRDPTLLLLHPPWSSLWWFPVCSHVVPRIKPRPCDSTCMHYPLCYQLALSLRTLITRLLSGFVKIIFPGLLTSTMLTDTYCTYCTTKSQHVGYGKIGDGNASECIMSSRRGPRHKSCRFPGQFLLLKSWWVEKYYMARHLTALSLLN